MRPQYQVEILRQRIVRPAPRFLDGSAAPDAARPVELEGHAAAGADILLDGEVRVLHQPLSARQPVPVAVAPFDAGLHESRLGSSQHGRHRAAQPVGWRDEVGVEHGDIGSVTKRHASRKRARLEASALTAPHMVGIDAALAQAGDGVERDIRRQVGAVVEQLDLEQVARPVERAGGHDGAFDDHRLVVDRDLNKHARQLGR